MLSTIVATEKSIGGVEHKIAISSRQDIDDLLYRQVEASRPFFVLLHVFQDAHLRDSLCKTWRNTRCTPLRVPEAWSCAIIGADCEVCFMHRLNCRSSLPIAGFLYGAKERVISYQLGGVRADLANTDKTQPGDLALDLRPA